MDRWGSFRHKPQPQSQKVTTGRFEIEQNGEVAYLEYSLGGNVLELVHTEVPEKLPSHESRVLPGGNCSPLDPRARSQGGHHLSDGGNTSRSIPEYSDLVMR